MLPALKVGVIVIAVGLAVMAVLYGQYILFGPADDTPRTELERAVVAAEQSVRANPEDPTARVKLAAAYLEEGSAGLAIEQAELAIELAPDDPAGYYVLGLAQNADGAHDEAVENLTVAVETEGQVAQFYQDAYVALARAQEARGDVESAIAALDEAVENGPENALLLYERGSIYEREGNLSYALMDYAWALTYAPSYQPAREAHDRIANEHPEVVEEVQALFDEEMRVLEQEGIVESGGTDSGTGDSEQ
jgi:tetratricopeptide (TPR) repeat protein